MNWRHRIADRMSRQNVRASPITKLLRNSYPPLAIPVAFAISFVSMQKKKPLQIVTVGIALSMLAAYVVRSQLQQTHTVAPGSKSDLITSPGQAVNGKGMTQVEARDRAVFARGSKSLAPVVCFGSSGPATASTSSAPAPAPPALA